jgi:hypothetical protein
MQLTSEGFENGGKIPAPFTCDGAEVSPALAWSGEPVKTRSFALVCSDPDAPSGTWYHWAIFDIPAAIHALAEGHSPAIVSPPQAINDFGKRGYGGPCPPHGHGNHHYHFTLYALDVERLGIPGAPRCREVEKAAKRHAIASADLIGRYGR